MQGRFAVTFDMFHIYTTYGFLQVSYLRNIFVYYIPIAGGFFFPVLVTFPNISHTSLTNKEP